MNKRVGKRNGTDVTLPPTVSKKATALRKKVWVQNFTKFLQTGILLPQECPCLILRRNPDPAQPVRNI